jgi:hypothetical protein
MIGQERSTIFMSIVLGSVWLVICTNIIRLWRMMYYKNRFFPAAHFLCQWENPEKISTYICDVVTWECMINRSTGRCECVCFLEGQEKLGFLEVCWNEPSTTVDKCFLSGRLKHNIPDCSPNELAQASFKTLLSGVFIPLPKFPSQFACTSIYSVSHVCLLACFPGIRP